LVRGGGEALRPLTTFSKVSNIKSIKKQ